MRLNHPNLPNVSKDVDDALAEKWLENGWTAVEAPKPKPPAKKAQRKSS